MSADVKGCGTYSGYQKHKRRGEPACEPCTIANREYHREYRDRPHARAEARRVNSARQRALWRLADLHREDYLRLCDEELGR